MPTATVTAGTFNAGPGQDYYGYYTALGMGSIVGEIAPSGTTNYLLMSTGFGGNGLLLWQVNGDVAASLAGLTGIKINGVAYPVSSAPAYDGSGTNTQFGSGEIPTFVVGSPYAVELVGVQYYAGPTWVGATAGAGSTAATSITFATSGRTAGDKLYIAIATANQAIATPTGFTEVPTVSPQSRGTAAAIGGIRLALFEKVSDGTETTVAIADSGDHQYAVGFVVRPASGQSIAIEAAAGKNAAAGTAHSGNALTTSAGDCLIIDVWGTDRDSAGPSYSAQANPSLANLTERFDAGTTQGVGSGSVIYTGEKLAAGSVSATTATSAASVAYCAITLALKNVPSLATPIYKGAIGASIYKGIQTEAQLYRGNKDLFA